ncbi:hypothetical protein [Tritonibacter horizontis]|uniref:Uncharacterized protein n=1 Tax=Tritonibacter horizontis TaxID=1768241 RepID=A0A132BUV0_9RHOB|nr:hypothetical protein [Tritonibacter horizontis]KUP91520.1 hypothetical protein TRIHO_36840 [Tritonibacter horizontis]
MLARMTSAAIRGLLVALLIALPSLLLPVAATQSPEIVTLMALLAGGLVFAEYYSHFPSFLEFRNAPPLNRSRFFFIALCMVLLSLLASHPFQPTGLTALVHKMALSLGEKLDFAYSPVQLTRLMMPTDVPQYTVELVRAAAGLAYLISLISVAYFACVIRLRNWPLSNGAFNVWVNLPLFDPTTGGDVVTRLQRDAKLHIIAGVLMPFLVPALIQMSASLFDPALLGNPQLLIWCVTGWAMVPASMITRGMARLRVADLIEQKRRSFDHDKDLQTV